MNVKIKLDATAIRKLQDATVKAAEMTMESLYSDVVAAQVMPFDLGDMQNNQTFTVVEEKADGFITRLVTGSPQARRLYYHPEYDFQTVNNPNAKGLWLEDWIDGDKSDFVQQTFKDIYKKEAGL